MSGINEIRAVARREHRAEQTRTEAEAAWRSAWWDTTMALAGAGREGVLVLLRAAAEELGQSVGYLRQRRLTGAHVDPDLEVRIIKTLPPRASRAWAQAGRRIDQAAADELLANERDQVSVREQTRRMGTQPPSWQREDERTATPEQIQRAVAERPDEVARALGSAPPRAQREFNRAREEGARDRLAAAGQPGNFPERSDGEIAYGQATTDLRRARELVNSARLHLADAALDDELRDDLLAQVDRIEIATRALRQGLSGEIDRELLALLNEGGAA